MRFAELIVAYLNDRSEVFCETVHVIFSDELRTFSRYVNSESVVGVNIMVVRSERMPSQTRLSFQFVVLATAEKEREPTTTLLSAIVPIGNNHLNSCNGGTARSVTGHLVTV